METIISCDYGITFRGLSGHILHETDYQVTLSDNQITFPKLSKVNSGYIRLHSVCVP